MFFKKLSKLLLSIYRQLRDDELWFVGDMQALFVRDLQD